MVSVTEVCNIAIRRLEQILLGIPVGIFYEDKTGTDTIESLKWDTLRG